MLSPLLRFLLLKTCAAQLCFGGGGRTGLCECIFYVLTSAPPLAVPQSKEAASVIKKKERKKKRHSCVRGSPLPAAHCSLREEHKSCPSFKQLKIF